MTKLKIILLLCLIAAPLQAVTPMNYFTSLVAGDDDAGYQDGAFDDARFNQPCGMTFDDKGQRLFVADTRNNCIRVIYLDEDNRVETLVRSSSEAKEEGTLDQIDLTAVQNLIYLPGDQLIVNGGPDQYLKYIDLGKKTFRTLAKGVGPLWDMVYRPEDDSIYMTDPSNNRFDRFDMKTGKVIILMQNNKVIPAPMALCSHNGKLFISDMKTSSVYDIEAITGSTSLAVSAVMNKIGVGKGILKMAFAGDTLYTFQSGPTPLAVLWPNPRPVGLTSGAAIKLSSKDRSYFPLLVGSVGTPMGFAVSPRETDRFYISQPRPHLNSVISVKDGHINEHWAARDPVTAYRDLPDFEYPAQKPAKTFRVLVVGTSRVVTAPTAMSDEELANTHINMSVRDFHSLRMNTFAKRLELLLNTEAALEGVSEHFEVLELGRPGLKLPFFVNEQVPPIVQKYDIDLVLGMITPTFEEAFEDYFIKPMTPDGIPGTLDQEYLTKPWRERVPLGVPENFLKQCFDLKLVREESPKRLKFVFFQDLLNHGGTEIRNDLIEMLGKPLQLLDHRLRSFKTNSTGKAPLLKFFFVPDPDCDANDHYLSFWSDLCVQNGLDMLDLSKPYEDLKYSYYPATEACCHQHYTAYGNELIAQLLMHYLPQKGWIPLGSGNPSK